MGEVPECPGQGSSHFKRYHCTYTSLYAFYHE